MTQLRTPFGEGTAVPEPRRPMPRLLRRAGLCLAVLAQAACVPAAVIGSGAVVARSVTQERSTGAALGDNDIAIRINNRLLRQSASLFTDVTVDVTEGRVVLLGGVESAEDKATAIRIAQGVPGVVAVEDALTVTNGGGVRRYVNDVWVSNQLRAALLGDPNIASQNYSVETIQGVVHLTGLARSGDELQRVIDHATAIDHVTRVVSHVLTIDDPRRVADAGLPG